MGSVGMEKVTSLPVGSFTLYEFFNLPVATEFVFGSQLSGLRFMFPVIQRGTDIRKLLEILLVVS